MILSKPPILVFILLIACAVSAKAQCVETPTDDCITVHQSILDRSAKAVTELVEARKVIANMLTERGLTDVERTAYKTALDVSNTALDVFKKGVVDRDTVIAMQQKALELYSTLVEKLQSQINKPKSAWQKFIGAVEKIVVFAAGAALGRGL